MTCSIVIPVQDRYVVVTDSRVLDGTRVAGEIKKTAKIGAITVCWAGELGVAQRILHEWGKLDPPEDLSCVEEWVSVARDQKKPDEEGVDFILVSEYGVIAMDTDGSYVDRTGQVTVVGSASHFVEGFLASGRKPKTTDAARRLAVRALKEAHRTFVCIGPPYTSIVV